MPVFCQISSAIRRTSKDKTLWLDGKCTTRRRWCWRDAIKCSMKLSKERFRIKHNVLTQIMVLELIEIEAYLCVWRSIPALHHPLVNLSKKGVRIKHFVLTQIMVLEPLELEDYLCVWRSIPALHHPLQLLLLTYLFLRLSNFWEKSILWGCGR